MSIEWQRWTDRRIEEWIAMLRSISPGSAHSNECVYGILRQFQAARQEITALNGMVQEGREEIARLKAELETAKQKAERWYPSTGWCGAYTTQSEEKA